GMGATIMIADDEEEILDVLSATLRDDQRYRLVLARDGEEALALARQEVPDLLFLDVLMPKISGLEVCRRLKSDPDTRNVIIVMVTGLIQESNRREALEAGADDYLAKPFSPSQLLHKVDQVLGLPRQGGADVPEMEPPGAAVVKASVGPGSGVEVAPIFDQLSRQQLETYARELHSLFREERRLRGELGEKKRDLEQRIRETQALNRLLQTHGGQFLQQADRLTEEMGALSAQAQSLLPPGPPHAAGLASDDETQ
ncbi:MAG: response regulator, partial [Chloroflexota bacterium]